jgi:hypothetical protein
MGRYARVVAILVILCAPRAANAACGHERVEVHGSAQEIAVACVALADVLAYFARAGYAVEPEVTVSFQDEVWYEYEGGAGRRVKVSGSYDLRRRTIEITRWTIDPATARRPWGQEWGQPIVASILQHEFVHMAATTILGEGRYRLGGAWHEFVAYAVQFELMDGEMRDAILTAHLDLAPFDSPWAVSQLTYAAAPDAFGLRAYLYAQERGGMAFIKEILENKAELATGETSHISPWR